MAAEADMLKLLEKFNLSFKELFSLWLNNDSFCDALPENISSKLKKVVNSVKYWSARFKNLQHDRMAILTTFTMEEAKRISYSDILRNLDKTIGLNQVQEVFIPENRQYLGIFFKDIQTCNNVKKNFLKVDEAFVIFVDWVVECMEVVGRIHFLPPFTSVSKVSHTLSKYLFNLKMEKMPLRENGGYNILSSVVNFKGTLKNIKDLDSIPHFQEFDGNQTLITIKGRRPVCIRCKNVGHTKKDCEYVFCFSCRLMAKRNHSCEAINNIPSYATTLRKNAEFISDPTLLMDLDFVVDSDDDKEKSQTIFEQWGDVSEIVKDSPKSATALSVVKETIELIIDRVVSSDNTYTSDLDNENSLSAHIKPTQNRLTAQEKLITNPLGETSAQPAFNTTNTNSMEYFEDPVEEGDKSIRWGSKTYSKIKSNPNTSVKNNNSMDSPIFCNGTQKTALIKSEKKLNTVDMFEHSNMEAESGLWTLYGKRKMNSEDNLPSSEDNPVGSVSLAKKGAGVGIHNFFESLEDELSNDL